MSKIKIELPDTSYANTRQLTEDFMKKVVEPFNNAFSEFKTPTGALCFKLSRGSLRRGQIVIGEFHPLLIEDREEILCGVVFSLGGKAAIRYRKGESMGSKGGRTWDEAMAEVLSFIKSELQGLKDTSGKIKKLSKAIKFLEG